MSFFSDAVFAIAITLLVIEIHPPALRWPSSDMAYWSALGHITPHFVGFFISFFVIGAFWAGHHRAFACARHWSPKLYLPNILMLGAIAAMPFFTAFSSANPNARVPVMLYCGWLVLTALLNLNLQRMLTSAPIVAEGADPHYLRELNLRALAVLLGALSALVVAYFLPAPSLFLLSTIPLWVQVFKRLAR